MKNKLYKNRICSCLLAGVMIFSLSACGKSDENGSLSAPIQTDSSLQSVDGTSNNETIVTDGQNGEIQNNNTGESENRILIAYFTAAENSGVDAIASASYTMIGEEAVGRVRAVADMIRA